jgi:serine/threonine-protein kinase 11
MEFPRSTKKCRGADSLVTTVIDKEKESVHVRRKIINYLFQKRIGQGAYAKVYLAIDMETQQKYAVKKINTKELARTTAGLSQLEREIRLMRAFHHPNILKLHEVLYSRNERSVYLVLDYADLGSLGDFVREGIPISVEGIRSIMKQIVGALSYIHSRGFVHQDVKPGNILLMKDGRALLADFGIGQSFQSSSLVVGTPAFQAPEALADDEDVGYVSIGTPETEDVWALGITLYQLMFRQLPFTGENLYEIICNIRTLPLSIPEGTSPEIAELLRAMLVVDPKKRVAMSFLRRYPWISEALDLVPEAAAYMKGRPEESETNFQIVEEEAVVCDDSFSFGSIPLSPPEGLAN